MTLVTNSRNNTRTYTQRGYTLLFAVLTAALVLGVAVFILGVSKKQFALSVAARDSMYSLYAADTGMECAATAFWAGVLATTSTTGVIHCTGADSDIVVWSSPSLPIAGLTALVANVYQTSQVYIGLYDGTCALVQVTNGDDVSGNNIIVIDSRGYNFCDATTKLPKTGSRTVERALRLTYQ